MAFSILGCPHNHLSFPIVTSEPRQRCACGSRIADPVLPAGRPHVTCLDCGREFWYDWHRMRRVAPRPQPVYVPGRAA